MRLAVRLTQAFATFVVVQALMFVAGQWLMFANHDPDVLRAGWMTVLGQISSLLLALVALWLAALLAALRRARDSRRFGIASVCLMITLAMLPALAECRMPPRAGSRELLPWAWLALGGGILVSWLRVHGGRTQRVNAP